VGADVENEDLRLCTKCKIGYDSNEGVLEYGTIQQRLAVGIMDYVDPSGKKPVAYAKIMKKRNLTEEDVIEEAGKFNIQIDAVHFVSSEKPAKRGRPSCKKEKPEKQPTGAAKGRPKKSKKVVQITGNNDDLFAALVAGAKEEESSDEEVEEKKDYKESALKAASEFTKTIPEFAATDVDSEKEEEKAEMEAKKEANKAAFKEDLELKKAKFAAEKAEKEALKAAEKAAKEAAKEAEKAAKEAAKEAEKAAKKAEKEAKKETKKPEKETKKPEKEKKETKKPEKVAKKDAKQSAVDAALKATFPKAKKPDEKKPEKVEEPVVEEVDNDEEDVVDKIIFEGKKYLKSQKTGIIYDYDKQVNEDKPVMVGKWNKWTSVIDFYSTPIEQEEEEEEEYDEESDDEA
jgi:hypothetical protein